MAYAKHNNLAGGFRKLTLSFAAILTFMTGAAYADVINLDMEGSTATIPKGNTVTRKIFGIPKFGGTLRLRYKWHAVNIIPNTFNPLKVVVQKGTNTLSTKTTCYSTHSNKTPKCDVTLNVTQAVANATGDWRIVITNNSGDEVISFNIEKGSDINPAVPAFKSTYTPNCPGTVNLDMEGADTATVTKGGVVTRKLFGIAKSPGTLTLKAKWHSLNPIPNTFNQLKIELLRPNGTVAKTGNYFSFHSNKTPKYSLTHNITAAEAAQSGSWSLRITNNSANEIISFNIEKGSDFNPAVPAFKSTYKATCN